jgi:pyruvate kinase
MGLIDQLDAIRADMLSLEQELHGEIALVPPQAQASARNLVHYMALRRHDLRPLQRELAAAGLSSLGRSEAHVLDSVNRVLQLLHLLAHPTVQPPAPEQPPPVDMASGGPLLEHNTLALLGPSRPERGTRIMVTAPPEAAANPGLARELADAGMDLLRINCAHDSPEAWGQMARNAREALHAGGRRGLVLFDLAGPKPRTGPMAPGPPIVHWHVPRDERGMLTTPARIFLGQGPVPDEADATLPVDEALLARIEEGDASTYLWSGSGRRFPFARCRLSSPFFSED